MNMYVRSRAYIILKNVVLSRCMSDQVTSSTGSNQLPFVSADWLCFMHESNLSFQPGATKIYIWTRRCCSNGAKRRCNKSFYLRRLT